MSDYLIKIQNLISNIRSKISDLLKLRNSYESILGKSDPSISENVQHLSHLSERMEKYRMNYENLMSLSDSELLIHTSNKRINFEDDPIFKKSPPDITRKFLRRTLTETEYWVLVFQNQDPLKGLRIRCYICGRETSYDAVTDDGVPKLCIDCHRQKSYYGIPPDYNGNIEDYFKYKKDHPEQNDDS